MNGQQHSLVWHTGTIKSISQAIQLPSNASVQVPSPKFSETLVTWKNTGRTKATHDFVAVGIGNTVSWNHTTSVANTSYAGVVGKNFVAIKPAMLPLPQLLWTANITKQASTWPQALRSTKSNVTLNFLDTITLDNTTDRLLFTSEVQPGQTCNVTFIQATTKVTIQGTHWSFYYRCMFQVETWS